MKKFCSSCGNQLELSQRFCSQCGAVNPFFVPAFTLLSDQSETLEILRLEKERIEMELKAKLEAQQEYERQKTLKAEQEKLEKEKAEQLEKERLEREKLAREKIEARLKKVIEEVEEKAERTKKETLELVQEVQNEVKQEILEIDEENKRLKAAVKILSQNSAETTPAKIEPALVADILKNVAAEIIEEVGEPTVAVVSPKPSGSSFNPPKIILGIILSMGVFLIYFYITHVYNEQVVEATTHMDTAKPNTTPKLVTHLIVDTILDDDSSGEPKVVSEPEPIREKAKEKPAEEKRIEIKKAVAIIDPTEKPKVPFVVTESKVKADLKGKKISGCAIIVGGETELKSIDNLVLVEKTTDYTKYKCSIKLVNGNSTYNAVPYLYYNEDGLMIKVDGSNCE